MRTDGGRPSDRVDRGRWDLEDWDPARDREPPEDLELEEPIWEEEP